MTTADDILALLLVSVGEPIHSVRPTGDGRWALVTTSLIVQCEGIRGSDPATIAGRIIAEIFGDVLGLTWHLELDDGTTVILERVRAVKRGLTPIEGLPAIKTPPPKGKPN